jgi:hypothetical protein
MAKDTSQVIECYLACFRPWVQPSGIEREQGKEGSERKREREPKEVKK